MTDVLRNPPSDIGEKKQIIEQVFRQYDRNSTGELTPIQIQTLHGDMRIGGISHPQVLASINYVCATENCHVSELYDLLQEMDRRYFLLQDLRWEFSFLDRAMKQTITVEQAKWMVQSVHGKYFSPGRWSNFIKSRAIPGSGVAFAEIEVILCDIPNKQSLEDEEKEKERLRRERQRIREEQQAALKAERERRQKEREEQMKRYAADQKREEEAGRAKAQEEASDRFVSGETGKQTTPNNTNDDAMMMPWYSPSTLWDEEEKRRRNEEDRKRKEEAETRRQEEEEAERMRQLEEEERKKRDEEEELYKDAELHHEEANMAERKADNELARIHAEKERADEKKRKQLEEEESRWKVAKTDSRNKYLRYQLKVAIKARDKYQLEYSITEFKKAQLSDDDMDLERATRLLKQLSAKEGLKKAMGKREIEELEKAMTFVRKHGFEANLAKEMAEAGHLLSRLRRLERIRHEILELKQATVAEIRSYQNPPPIVHTVMTATFLLLGHKERETKDWKAVQALVGKTGKESLKRRCLELDATKVPLGPAKRANKLLEKFELDEVRDISAGAATFYVWATAMIEEALLQEESKDEEQ